MDVDIQEPPRRSTETSPRNDLPGFHSLRDLCLGMCRRLTSNQAKKESLITVEFQFLSYARNLFIPPSKYGIGLSTPVRSLGDAFGAAGAARNTVAFVDNGFTGGDISKIIDRVSAPLKDAGADIQILHQEDELLTTCRSSIRGVSACYAGAVFFASPTEGSGGSPARL